MSRRNPRWLPCFDCGQQVWKRPRWDRPILCLECATRHAIDAARQMSDKRGAAWDAWLTSNADGAPGRTPDT